MTYDELDPKVESVVSPCAASRAAVPMQTGFVRLGGTSASDAFPEEAYNAMMPMGRLYPSTREIS